MELDLEQKYDSLIKQLEAIKELKNCFNSDDEELLDSFISEVLRLSQEIRCIMCKSLDVRLSTLKIGRVFSDPSVQFFGIDWDFLFSKCAELKDNIAGMPGNLDLCLLDEIVVGLVVIEEQVMQHSMALMSGNLGKKKQREREMMQRRVALMALSKTQNKTRRNKEEKRPKISPVISLLQSLCLRFKYKK